MNFLRTLSLSLIVLLTYCTSSIAQEYAPEIVVTDCEGNEHSLHDALDSGKVIVIGWTMPCATCAAPLLAAHNVVLKYGISHPGVVEYWLADDYAETTCERLLTMLGESWSFRFCHSTLICSVNVFISSYCSSFNCTFELYKKSLKRRRDWFASLLVKKLPRNS